MKEQTQTRLLSLRSNSERKAILLIRSLAGDADLRDTAKQTIKISKGDRGLLIILARLVGIVLNAGMIIELPYYPYLTENEEFLLSLINKYQRKEKFMMVNLGTELSLAVRDAAFAMQKIGIFLPNRTTD